MNTIIIKCNTDGEICVDDNARINGMGIVLINESPSPIARYEFNSISLLRLTKILYQSDGVRIHFYGDVRPTMIYENTRVND